MFPPPWTGAQTSIGILLAGLAAFIEGCFGATMFIGKDLSVSKARAMIRVTKQHRSKEKRRMHFELIAELVWLASGQRTRISESSVRRYLGKTRSEHPMSSFWKRHWRLLQEALRFSPPLNVRSKSLISRRSSSRPYNSSKGPPKPPRPVPGVPSRGQRKSIEAFTECARIYLEAKIVSEFSTSQTGEKAQVGRNSCRDTEGP